MKSTQSDNLKLPGWLLLKRGEVALFASRPQCHMPTNSTTTYGFGGGFIGAESEAKITTENRGYGSLVITSTRIIVNCKSDVREWPISSIVSVSSRRTLLGSHLELRVANVGAARFFFGGDTKSGHFAEQAFQRARAEFSVDG